jgi:hypothetical protein
MDKSISKLSEENINNFVQQLTWLILKVL